MSSTGIVPINGGSVVLRTYLDESEYNTYLLGQYDSASTTNMVLVTSTHGLLISTTTVNVSSVSVSSIFANTISTNQLFICTIYYSTFTSSQLNYHSTIVNNLFTPTITFITMSGGTVSSQQVTSMTLGVNQGTFSTIIAPSLIVSSANVYQLSTINGTFSTLIGTNMTLSSLSTVLLSISSVFVGLISTAIISSITLQASTIIVGNDSFFETLGDVLVTSTLTASSIVTDSVVFSTMVLGSLSTSNLVASSIYQLTGGFSIQIGSTVITSTFFTPALNVYDSQSVSSMIGSSIVISTLTASTLYGRNQFFSVLTGPSTTVTNMIAPSIITSSIQFSTMYGTTATIPLIYASTLIFPTSYVDSTFSTSTIITTNTYTSSMITDSISVNNYYVNQPVYGQTIKKDSIDVFTNVRIGGLYAELDNTPYTLPLVPTTLSTQVSYTYGSTIQNKWIVGGATTTYINFATSPNGITWSGGGFPQLSIVYGIVWTGNLWVAVGTGPGNGATILTSPDGDNWTLQSSTLHAYGSSPNATLQIGLSIFCSPGNLYLTGIGIDVSGKIAYSRDGIYWYNITGSSGFSEVHGIAWNGVRLVAIGTGITNRIVWSDTPTVDSWSVGLSGNSIFTLGNAIIWTGHQWIAGGQGPYRIAYSVNGNSWTGSTSGNNVFSAGNPIAVYGLGWNGSMAIAVGLSDNHTIAYSTDEGISWIGLGKTIFTTNGNSVTWNGQMWVATGQGTNTIAYSYNGINWYGIGADAPNYSGYCAAFNFRRPYIFYTALDSGKYLRTDRVPGTPSDPIVPAGSQLDVVSEPYYNSGYTNFSAVFQTNAI